MQAVASQYSGQLKTLKVLSTPHAPDLSSYKPETNPALSQIVLVN
jgi:hypothetical protein